MLTAGSRRRRETSNEAKTGVSPQRLVSDHIKIALVESDLLVREGLVALLNTVEDFECIGDWTKAEDALRTLSEVQPDILLLDVRQLQASGLTLLQRLPTVSPSMLVFVTTNSPEEWWPALTEGKQFTRLIVFARLPALRYGICGVLSKERGFQSIADRIRGAFEDAQERNGSFTSSPRDLYRQPLQLDSHAGEVQVGSLTLREWEVVRLIGQGRSNKEIAREMQLGYSTVKNYVSSILKKLQLDGRTQIALLVH